MRLRGHIDLTLITLQMKMADVENIRRVSEHVLRKAAGQGTIGEKAAVQTVLDALSAVQKSRFAKRGASNRTLSVIF